MYTSMCGGREARTIRWVVPLRGRHGTQGRGALRCFCQGALALGAEGRREGVDAGEDGVGGWAGGGGGGYSGVGARNVFAKCGLGFPRNTRYVSLGSWWKFIWLNPRCVKGREKSGKSLEEKEREVS